MRKIVFLLVLCIMILAGCKNDSNQFTKVKDLEFTVVEDEDLPEELRAIIEQEKQHPFKYTCNIGEYLYIVTGFGEQPTGGYSIQVKDFYLTKNSIVLDTELLGPSKDDVVTMVLTYPYIVIKTEFLDKSVVFK